ncbi:phosphatase PAP2 family protein [Neisseriaceae bacterium B1]
MKHNTSKHLNVFILLAIICPYLLFFAITWYLWQYHQFAFDVSLLWDIHTLSSSIIVALAIGLHWFGKWYIASIVVFLWAFYQYRQQRPFHALFVILAAAVPTALMSLFKAIVERPRPELWQRLVEESSSSFPSGHSTYAAAFATALILITWRSKWRAGAIFVGIAFTLLMAFSRMVLGVHYPSDVFAGLLNGMAAVCIVYVCLRTRLGREQGFRQPEKNR